MHSAIIDYDTRVLETRWSAIGHLLPIPCNSPKNLFES